MQVLYGDHQRQYTILSKKKYVSSCIWWVGASFQWLRARGIIKDVTIYRILTPISAFSQSPYFRGAKSWIGLTNITWTSGLLLSQYQVGSNVYRPSTFLYHYILWTFHASYTSVTLTFLLIYVIVNLVSGGLLYVAGSAEPYCITASGEYFGAHPQTKFSDAFALSWMTLTTVVCIRLRLISWLYQSYFISIFCREPYMMISLPFLMMTGLWNDVHLHLK